MLVFLSWDWDVYLGYGVLTHSQMGCCLFRVLFGGVTPKGCSFMFCQAVRLQGNEEQDDLSGGLE